MEVMRVARYCRDDVLRAVKGLVPRVTKWTPLDDKGLRRSISYLHHATGFRKIGFISGPWSELRLVLLVDANFAGDYEGIRLLGIVSCVCEVLARAETLSAVTGAKTLGCPALDLWEKIFVRAIEIDMFKKNPATMRALLTGKAPTWTHFPRAHGTSSKWMCSDIVAGNINLCDCETEVVAADIWE